ncbi:MAG: heavy-metal-associated domain-containing protein [Candidatus Kapabacteria bacterium]|jgi:periplasmic mercuric ion binding protein|nr:heavy-metal-associated domain-containing protein [Candidatus Kapabacteria bacterium]
MLKKIKSISSIFLAILFVVSVSYAGEIKEASYQTNLHCGSCASKIQKGLKKAGGVIETKADVASKVVTVKYDADKTDDSKIKQLIADMGYKADLANAKECKSGEKACCKTTGKACDNKDKTSKMSGKDCCDTKATKSNPK